MKQRKLTQQNINDSIADYTLRMALHCVRNTVIENYHAQGKISDAEMKAFNIEVVNKLYTFLQITQNPKYSKELELVFKNKEGFSALFHLPYGWNKPILHKGFITALKNITDHL